MPSSPVANCQTATIKFRDGRALHSARPACQNYCTMRPHDQLTAARGLVNSLHWLWSKQASISATLCRHTNVTVQLYHWSHCCCCRPTNLPPAQRAMDPSQPRFVTRGHVMYNSSSAAIHCRVPRRPRAASHAHSMSCLLLYEPWRDCTGRQPHARGRNITVKFMVL